MVWKDDRRRKKKRQNDFREVEPRKRACMSLNITKRAKPVIKKVLQLVIGFCTVFFFFFCFLDRFDECDNA